jgi:hypothetical protein
LRKSPGNSSLWKSTNYYFRHPENCPNCQGALTLEALAYYDRYITTATALVLLIWVRRFLCRVCGVSVSCLPSFAQPYRPVNTSTVEAGFNGQGQKPEVRRWALLIETYWQRFQEHLPRLVRQVGNAFGPVPLQPTARGFWRQLLEQGGDLASVTRKPGWFQDVNGTAEGIEEEQ